MTLLRLAHLGVRLGGREVVRDVSLSLDRGELVGLVGPNGAGKTTLLRAALGLLPHAGQSSLATLAPKERARRATFLPQQREIAWPVTVEALVALGRTPFGAPDVHHPAVARALRMMELTAFRHRRATALSGGEQARALIARALAQGAPLVLADEPVAGLDPGGQIATMELFARLARDGGRGIMLSLHDLGLAARHCTRLLLMDRGRIVADGAPAAVLSDALMARVFGIRAYRAQTAEGMIFQPVAVIEASRADEDGALSAPIGTSEDSAI